MFSTFFTFTRLFASIVYIKAMESLVHRNKASLTNIEGKMDQIGGHNLKVKENTVLLYFKKRILDSFCFDNATYCSCPYLPCSNPRKKADMIAAMK